MVHIWYTPLQVGKCKTIDWVALEK